MTYGTSKRGIERIVRTPPRDDSLTRYAAHTSESTVDISTSGESTALTCLKGVSYEVVSQTQTTHSTVLHLNTYDLSYC
ncbi:hypothetical protein CY34DRAFT_808913 [Suillus luteus UH-Slu-Lm8-n1]|uniref:Uncharacterized protein n=1 Tax=Suillus luteus UH-Slu-Lm8-n1 TaxID=930992 RepID=A0A0D0AWY9_9AGAM|nr:hypothetical protein CY34DRAFT_808913 [Suillus luteus UH-Slu-Lm8-n1]